MIEKPEYPLCVDCEHYKEKRLQENLAVAFGLCFSMVGKPSPVDGKPIVPSPANMMRPTICGLEGKMFIKRGEKKQ